MRAIWSGLIGAAIALAATAASAASIAFEDNKLNFKSCDGASVSARWRGHDFSLAEPGKSLGDGHASFKFESWDGKCKIAGWDRDRATFVVGEEGALEPSAVVRYVAPDGSKWAGIRAGDGFFVTRMAAQGEEITAQRTEEIASWLARTSKEFTPGAELAERLKAQVD